MAGGQWRRARRTEPGPAQSLNAGRRPAPDALMASKPMTDDVSTRPAAGFRDYHQRCSVTVRSSAPPGPRSRPDRPAPRGSVVRQARVRVLATCHLPLRAGGSGSPGSRSPNLPPGVAAPRPSRRRCSHHAARSPGHGVRGAGRTAGSHPTVRDDDPACRLRAHGASRILVLGPTLRCPRWSPPRSCRSPPISGRARRARSGARPPGGALFVIGGLRGSGTTDSFEAGPHRYLIGIALVVIVGQLPKLFGYAGDAPARRGRWSSSRASTRRILS